MAAPIVYRSTDGSAPTLSGTAGDLNNLLNKCLVVGYGAKSPAGWSSAFGPTSNIQVFRQGAGSMRYLRVDDSGGGTGGAKEALIRGWEATPDTADTVDPQAGRTGPFPSIAQIAGGGVIRKSTAANGTTRTWILIADDRTFYLFVITGDNAGVYYGTCFGDIYSFSTGGDSFNTIICCRYTQNDGTQFVQESLPQLVTNGMGAGSGSSGHYIARAVSGLGGSIICSKIGDYSKMVPQAAGNVDTLRGQITYPNPTDGGLWLYPVRWVDAGFTAGTVRGRMRGFYHMVHTAASFADGDTFSGAASGPYSGKTFLIIKNAGQGLVSIAGAYCIETTAWEHN